MDVHMDNSMNRTVDHQQGKVYYAVNHDLSIGKIIAYPRDVEMMLKDIAWSDIGKDFPGTTQALMFIRIWLWPLILWTMILRLKKLSGMKI